jgi:dTDP-alpha-D-glucose dehydrogenase
LATIPERSILLWKSTEGVAFSVVERSRRQRELLHIAFKPQPVEAILGTMADPRGGSKEERALPRIAIVGFGYVGTILSAYLARRGFRVTAVETQANVVQSIKEGKLHIRELDLSDALLPLLRNGQIDITSSHESVGSADVIIVTVGTPLGRGTAPDLSALTRVAKDLIPHLRKGQVVIVKSTVPPGTTRKVVGPILERSGLTAGVDFHLSFCPERLAEGNALREIPDLPVVVSGINDESARVAEEFWRTAGLKTSRVGSLEAAELVKLADNVWIDLTVAMTNELARVCEQVGVDALDVIRAANTLKKGSGHVNYLHPGIGVGGSCLTKDPWFFAEFAASVGTEVSLPQAGRRVNESVPAYIAAEISRELTRRGAPDRSKVAVLGYAFKGATGDIRNTPVEPILRQLSQSGRVVALYDPWVLPDYLREKLGSAFEDSLGNCVRNASCVLIATNHPEFVGLHPDFLHEAAPGCFVYDGWHILDPAEFVKAGFDYLSPGKTVRGTPP